MRVDQRFVGNCSATKRAYNGGKNVLRNAKHIVARVLISLYSADVWTGTAVAVAR
jgi:hypothetical protein